ncbi:dihydropteroate synthase [Deltaproteobacteria bacterium OttesenSCG-928-K17]|nr:dihydropteroate synthase [Deltaproteobacteria bacterium OttesenSCG-928-K17]
MTDSQLMTMNEEPTPAPMMTTSDARPDFLTWKTRGGQWTLDFSRPLIMAIINLTPDSFSDGGRFAGPDEAVRAALAEEADGADIFDLGAESTRPGSEPVSAEDEWARLAPVVKSLGQASTRPISIDTYRADVAEKALAAGAAILNDIYAGRYDPRMLDLAAEWGVPIILMHMQGEPRTMQQEPHYDDVVAEVHDFLLERARAAESAGVPKEHIILDPGLGFGKNMGHNLSLIKHFDRAMPKGYRKLMALSRKAFLGRILNGAEPKERDGLTAVADALALMAGAEIIRVHRTAPNKAAADLVHRVKTA